MNKWLSGFVITLTGACALAATAPPRLPFDSVSWKPLSTAKPASELRLGNFSVIFEDTTLDLVRAAAGSADIQGQGDGGERIYLVCYTLEGAARVWIGSHGEMGGANHAVTSVIGQEQNDVRPTDDCPALPKQLQPISLDNGLWLGATEKEATKVLGPVSHSEGPWRSFDYQGKVPGNCAPDGFDLTNWILYKADSGRIVEIAAGQVTSC
jgi:hypothetical protein